VFTYILPFSSWLYPHLSFDIRSTIVDGNTNFQKIIHMVQMRDDFSNSTFHYHSTTIRMFESRNYSSLMFPNISITCRTRNSLSTFIESNVPFYHANYVAKMPKPRWKYSITYSSIVAHLTYTSVTFNNSNCLYLKFNFAFQQFTDYFGNSPRNHFYIPFLNCLDRFVCCICLFYYELSSIVTSRAILRWHCDVSL
jgi:hypothetical protein